MAGRKPDELLKIMKASAMGDTCFTHILGYIREGMTELEIAGEIEATLRKLGSSALAFPTICVSGVNSTKPHGEPSEKRIEAGDFLTMDFGAVVDGYCGDMTRTVAIGCVSDEQRTVYEVVLRAQEAALAACKTGVRCFDVDKTARDIISEAGYGEFFVHGTGHAVGTEVHEEPYLNTRSEAVLEINMPVTVEPGIYIPEKFGVRIEDLAIITEFGIINTVKSPKNLIIL